MITENNWDLWLLGFSLIWAAIEFLVHELKESKS